ncbi:helix-turn-helix transcriptional regulator [Sutcliffiella cohnii]
MNREELIEIVTSKLKLIRTEQQYTQDKMADMIGISKKTLVQIEKGRMQAGWTTTIAICSLFRDSEILTSTLGDDPLVLMQTIAFDSYATTKTRTLGGKIWWREIQREGEYILQQNVVSNHYRIINNDYFRVFSSFNIEDAMKRLTELS